MKKKILLISGVLLTLSIIMIIIFNNMDNKENNIISNINKDTEVINSNMITMMYETEAGTGIYEETKDTTWPESGYIFNENLSGCENGGELEYNSINKTVNLLSNKSDRCYVYFDKYDGVWIDNVSVTNVTGSSVTLDISATSENGSITTYYYSLNDSEEYQETTTNPITINDLNKLTEYKISIYAIDSTNARSNIYEVMVTTTDESGPVINSVSVSNINSIGFTLTVDAASDIGIERYYFILDNESDGVIVNENYYSFENLEDGINYNVSVFVEDKNGLYSDRFNINVSTDSIKSLLADYIKNLYTNQGTNGIYYHTSSLTNSAGDNSYRYAGANPNNYLCFGSTKNPCPDDNLYRIIGVFDSQVKVIKNSNIGSQMWNDTMNNTWSTAYLNNEILNGSFLSTFDNFWVNQISYSSWQVGGMTTSNGRSYGAQRAYNYEVGNNSAGVVHNAKIGLMYVSDYYYAATNNYWTYYGYASNSNDYRQAVSSNWLYTNVLEWTITRCSDYSYISFLINATGYVYNDFDVDGLAYARPVFYLNSNVSYVSGNGSKSSPIRIL